MVPISSDSIWFSYEKLGRVGQGEYGKVYRARDRRTGDLVAIKATRIDYGGIPASSMREIGIMKSMDHVNIMRCLGVEKSVVKNKVYVIMEFADMDLGQLIIKAQREQTPIFNDHAIKHITWQILGGLAYAHDRRIVHRDLKPSKLKRQWQSTDYVDQNTYILILDNILLFQKGDHWVAKLADFGLSRLYDQPTKPLSPKSMTALYRAPEVLFDHRCYSLHVDMWSVGCILAELVRLRPLFDASSELELLSDIHRKLGDPDEITCKLFPHMIATYGESPESPLKAYVEGLSDHGVDLLKKLLDYNPTRRIRARHALGHVYFDELNATTICYYTT